MLVSVVARQRVSSRPEPSGTLGGLPDSSRESAHHTPVGFDRRATPSGLTPVQAQSRDGGSPRKRRIRRPGRLVAGVLLTFREYEALSTYCQPGVWSWKEAAHRMGIAPDTAKKHANSLLSKLDAGTITEAYAKVGWLKAPTQGRERFTEDGIARIAEGQRRRWAKWRAQREAAA